MAPFIEPGDFATLVLDGQEYPVYVVLAMLVNGCATRYTVRLVSTYRNRMAKVSALPAQLKELKEFE